MSWLTELEQAVNPALAAPLLAEGVEFFPAPEGTGWVARTLPEGRYLSLTDEERLVLLDLDGERTVLALAKRYSARHGTMGFFVVSGLVEASANAAMLADGPPDVVWMPLRQSVAMRSIAGRMSAMNRAFMYRKVPVDGVGAAVRWMYQRAGRLFFHPAGVAVAAVFAVAGFMRWLTLDHPRPSDLSIREVLVVALFASLSIIIHELGHALAVVHFGRHVNRAGLFFMFGSPGGFVDTGDMWLATRRQRITVTLAGPFATTLVGAATAFVAPQGNRIAAAMATSQYLILVANATPLLKLDAYYVLMDLLRIPNLRERSMAFLTGRFRRKVSEAWRAGNLVPRLDRRETVLLLYGTAAMGWLLLISISGLFLLPERIWQMGTNARTIGSQHVLGPFLWLGVVSGLALIGLQLWGARAKFAEVGRLVRTRFDRSHGWGATAIVFVVAGAVGGVLPNIIRTRSSASAEGWTHAFAALAASAAFWRGIVLIGRLRGSRWAAPVAGLMLANGLVVAAEILTVTDAGANVALPLVRAVVLVAVLAAAIAGGRLTIAAFGADLRAAWAPVLVGGLMCAAAPGLASLGGVLVGAGTLAASRLLHRPIVSASSVIDIPVEEDLTDRRRIVHLRRAVAALVEPVVAQYGELYGSAKRLEVLHGVNTAASDAGWPWWFVEDGRFVDRCTGTLTELVDVWGQSIDRIVSVVGTECGRRVADDAATEAYLSLPARLRQLVDEWLGEPLRNLGFPVSGSTGDQAADQPMLIRLTLGHLVRVPLREIGQAVGRDAIEAVIAPVNAVASRDQWGRWFRANGQMVDEMSDDRDDAATARDLLAMLYARLTTVAGLPLTTAAVQYARDTLPWELRSPATDLLTGPWADTAAPRRVRQRVPRGWPVPSPYATS